MEKKHPVISVCVISPASERICCVYMGLKLRGDLVGKRFYFTLQQIKEICVGKKQTNENELNTVIFNITFLKEIIQLLN